MQEGVTSGNPTCKIEVVVEAAAEAGKSVDVTKQKDKRYKQYNSTLHHGCPPQQSNKLPMLTRESLRERLEAPRYYECQVQKSNKKEVDNANASIGKQYLQMR